MRTGRLEIGGAAGDLRGGRLPGEMAGIRGGIVRVRGNSGERAGGVHLRRLMGDTATLGLGEILVPAEG